MPSQVYPTTYRRGRGFQAPKPGSSRTNFVAPAPINSPAVVLPQWYVGLTQPKAPPLRLPPGYWDPAGNARKIGLGLLRGAARRHFVGYSFLLADKLARDAWEKQGTGEMAGPGLMGPDWRRIYGPCGQPGPLYPLDPRAFGVYGATYDLACNAEKATLDLDVLPEYHTVAGTDYTSRLHVKPRIGTPYEDFYVESIWERPTGSGNPVLTQSAQRIGVQLAPAPRFHLAPVRQWIRNLDPNYAQMVTSYVQTTWPQITVTVTETAVQVKTELLTMNQAAVRQPPKKTKERKGNVSHSFKPLVGYIGARATLKFQNGLNALTEGLDWLSAFYYALPDDVQEPGVTPFRMAQLLLQNFDKLDMRKLVGNILLMELQDRFIGRLSGAARRKLYKQGNSREFLFYGPAI